MTTVLVSIEDVIGKHDQMRGFHPDVKAMIFFTTLRSGYNIILSSNVRQLKDIENWLVLNGITPATLYDRIMIREAQWDDLTITQLRLAHLTALQASRYDIELVVSADPAVVADAVSEGVQGILWASPTYLRPEHQPGGARVPEPWDAIVERVEHQKHLHAADDRKAPQEVW